MLTAPPHTEEPPALDENGQPLSKSALKKLKKQQQIAEKKAQKAAAAAAAATSGGGDQAGGTAAEAAPATAADEPPAPYGFEDLGVVRSTVDRPDVRYAAVCSLGEVGGPQAGETVLVRGRLAALRAGKSNCFLVVRSGSLYTVQACFFKDKARPFASKEFLSQLGSLNEESVIEVEGELVAAQVEACSQGSVEIAISRVRLVSAAAPALPFEVADAARSEAEVDASELTERPFPRIGQDLRLNNRWIDLRVPAHNSILRVKSAVCAEFRNALLAQGFVELQTPKLIAGASEGGAGVFTTDYFGQPACLAQSPQLYKQMALASDMDRVFEIGPVFRAENSNTRRHLCEFTGLDMEMTISSHYMEVIRVLHTTLVSIFDGVEANCAAELAVIRKQYSSERVRASAEPHVIHWEDAMEMLAAAGEEVAPLDDLSTAHERKLGALVAERDGVDLYFLDRFPSNVRPFYTMPAPDDARYSNSYDVFLRGEEICSGAQRLHVPELIEAALAAQEIPAEPLRPYIESMRYGMPPHGGGGLGLERLVFLYLGLDNVRKASMFPRDPNRCSP